MALLVIIGCSDRDTIVDQGKTAADNDAQLTSDSGSAWHSSMAPFCNTKATKPRLNFKPLVSGLGGNAAYVGDLRSLLMEGEFFEQRGFLKSFIRRIDYAYTQVTIQYTFPVNPQTKQCDEVLAIDKISGVDETSSATG